MRSPRRAPLPAEPQSGAHVNKPITPLVADYWVYYWASTLA